MSVRADIASFYRGKAAGIGFLRRPGRGSSLPLVLLHGIGSNAESFSSLMAALPASIDAIAWDAPGYALSSALSTSSPAPRDYAAALADFLDDLGIQHVVLAGHSLGSLFAGSFAAHHPTRVAAVALMSPALGYKVAAGAVLPPSVQARIDEIQELGPTTFAAKRAARLVDEPQQKPMIVAAVEKAMATVHVAGYAQAVRALGAGDLLADAARIKAPSLVAVGTKDVVTPPENARALYAALRGVKEIHEVPSSGHALPQEQAVTVAHVLTKFIEEHANG